MISKKLIGWFEGNARDLPWRRDRTPYKIWISEVMLQQTQVQQVIPYYNKFMTMFPDISSLAAASSQKVLKIWAGMGYYARVRNLHRSAKIIVDEYNGQIPRDRSALNKLPGFGPYITNAVLSLAYNQPFGVMDGNAIRVITRLFSIRADIRLTRTKNIVQKKIDAQIDKENPGKFNEAIMELGATVCHPANPDCPRCPLNDNCLAHSNHLISEIPFKSAKQKRPMLQVETYILSHLDRILLVKRPENGLLGGLWEFPTYRSDDFTPTANHTWIKGGNTMIKDANLEKRWTKITHAYTHFQVTLIPYWYSVKQKQFESEFYTDYKWIKADEITDYPVHKATQKIFAAVSMDLKIIAQ
jgi:A/G-specific adenine glycosylase